MCPVSTYALYRLLTSAFLLAHLMAQDLIRQAPAMLIRMQSSPALPRVAAPRQADLQANVSPTWAGSLAGDHRVAASVVFHCRGAGDRHLMTFSMSPSQLHSGLTAE